MLDDAGIEDGLDGARAEFLSDVLAGLARAQKSLEPKYFYDERGSGLFEAICLTPEYYPTRTETTLLARVGLDLAPRLVEGTALVEFGSGASDKTRLVLDAAPQITAYLPIDISAAALAPAARRIEADYPGVRVQPIAADFTQPMRRAELAGVPGVLGFFPGSTIGNFAPQEAVSFLRGARALLGEGALFLVGADLVKDRGILLAAYDDATGVTASFNLNLLTRINRELGGDFDLDQFAHRAVWNAALSRIEMHLESLSDQVVHVAGHRFEFRSGETLHTENSHKFTLNGFSRLANDAGWRVAQTWVSDANAFAEFLLSTC